MDGKRLGADPAGIRFRNVFILLRIDTGRFGKFQGTGCADRFFVRPRYHGADADRSDVGRRFVDNDLGRKKVLDIRTVLWYLITKKQRRFGQEELCR